MILNPHQSAVVLAVMTAGGTGTLTFKGADANLVSFKENGAVFVAQFCDDGGRDSQETYATFEQFRLAYTTPVPDLARAAAHYIPMAAEAKTMAQHVADGEGRN
ncbi:hypothetical protein [Bordetella genomosp. 11]|uniref:Uncharacterized protein n=1 Tax=Bordetella genomosp. 11 TaxID=1416808 RepID=A0A261UJZ2_9BORD|nr:hypothetical protein [Bordetella genomosp. 11]OZI61580.1 hypothetical protein CAL28_20060 [Bordetella genomosp. 11]